MSSVRVPPPASVGGAGAARPPGRTWVMPVRERAGSDAISLIGFVLIVAAVPLVLCNAVRILPNMTFGDPLIALATLAAAVVALDRRAPRTTVPGWLWGVGGVILFCGLVATFRTTTDGNLLPLVRMVVTVAVLPPVMAILLCTPRRVRIALEFWMFGAVASAVVGVLDLQFDLGISRGLISDDFVLYTKRAAGLAVHPNHLGLTSAMAFPVAAMMATRAVATGRSPLVALRFALYGAALFGGILVCGSRVAPIAAVAGVIVALAIVEPRLRSPLLAAGIVALVAGLAVVVLVGVGSSDGGLVVLGRLSGDQSAVGSDAIRSTYLTTARTDIDSNPFVGEGFSVVRDAHVLYLQLLQAGGVICAIAFVFMFLAYLSDARWLTRAPWLDAQDRLLAAGLAGGVVAWATAGIVSNSVYDRYLYVPFGFLLALRAIALRPGRAPGGRDAGARPAGDP